MQSSYPVFSVDGKYSVNLKEMNDEELQVLTDFCKHQLSVDLVKRGYNF